MGDHDHNHESIFLTQEEHGIFLLSQTKVNEEADKKEQQAFEKAIMEVHKQYNLRSKKTNENSSKKDDESKKTLENLPKKSPGWNDVESLAQKNPEILKRTNQIEVSSTIQTGALVHIVSMDKSEVHSLNKTTAPFSLEGELAKLKIPIPLSELMKKNAYRSQVIKDLSIKSDICTKALNVGSVHHSDTVNLVDDRPKLLFGPEVYSQTDNGIVASFYINLNIHDLILHNAMLIWVPLTT
jgi:hypothetical protein